MWAAVTAAMKTAKDTASKEGLTLIKMVLTHLAPAQMLELKAILAEIKIVEETVDVVNKEAEVVTDAVTQVVAAPAPDTSK